MTAKNRFNDDMAEAIHKTAAMLHKVGALDKATMRDFDARHLAVPSAIAPTKIKQLREADNVRQPFSRAISIRVRARSRSGRPAPSVRAAWR
jgi:putative transcriptional regulator